MKLRITVIGDIGLRLAGAEGGRSMDGRRIRKHQLVGQRVAEVEDYGPQGY